MWSRRKHIWSIREGARSKIASAIQRAVQVDRDGDRLDVLITVALARSSLAQVGQRFDPCWVVRLVVVPLQRFAHHHLLTPRTRPFVGPSCSFLSLSRSVQSPSIFARKRIAPSLLRLHGVPSRRTAFYGIGVRAEARLAAE
jgi:hypothetical protein